MILKYEELGFDKLIKLKTPAIIISCHKKLHTIPLHKDSFCVCQYYVA